MRLEPVTCIQHTAGQVAMPFEAGDAENIFRVGTNTFLFARVTAAPRTVVVQTGMFTQIKPDGTRGIPVAPMTWEFDEAGLYMKPIPAIYRDVNGDVTFEVDDPEDIEFCVVNYRRVG